MKRNMLLTLVLITTLGSAVRAQDEARLIYPATDADAKLDGWTPAKRVIPPALENAEYDPVTPIGQIRGVLDDLNAVKSQNVSILEKLGALRIGESKDVLPILERGERRRDAIGANVDALLQSSKTVGTKIDDLRKTTENIRATIEAAQKTAASVERIRTSRRTDHAVAAILGLVLIQLVWKAWATIAAKVRARADRWREMAAACELARKQLAEARDAAEGSKSNV